MIKSLSAGVSFTSSLITICVLWTTLLLSANVCGQTPPALDQFNGTWLADDAENSLDGDIDLAWNSKFIVRDGRFTITHFENGPASLHGTIDVDQNRPSNVDLHTEPIDLSSVWPGVKYPAATLPAIQQIENNRWTICFSTGARPQRPMSLHADQKNSFLLKLIRADDAFQDVPKDVEIFVHGSNGKPVEGAHLFQMMRFWHGGDSHAATRPMPQWRFYDVAQTGADGNVLIPYDQLQQGVGASRADRQMIGFAKLSPSSLAQGCATITLARTCEVHGTLQCAAFDQTRDGLGWTNTIAMHNGQQIGQCDSNTGTFDFNLPPGEYRLMSYGERAQKRSVDIVVPLDQSKLLVPPIELAASQIESMIGKSAPELDHVIGWKGAPVRLADLRGRYILLDFWGYWCGPCVAAMPTMMALHDRFQDQGLSIVGVHVDDAGEIKTSTQLDERLAEIKSSRWGGRDLPFPVALTDGTVNAQGQYGGVAGSYGITALTTVLIDRDGKVAGEFEFHDQSDAIDKMQKLLTQSR